MKEVMDHDRVDQTEVFFIRDLGRNARLMTRRVYACPLGYACAVRKEMVVYARLHKRAHRDVRTEAAVSRWCSDVWILSPE
jgi:hypothetical protein